VRRCAGAREVPVKLVPPAPTPRHPRQRRMGQHARTGRPPRPHAPLFWQQVRPTARSMTWPLASHPNHADERPAGRPDRQPVGGIPEGRRDCCVGWLVHAHLAGSGGIRGDMGRLVAVTLPGLVLAGLGLSHPHDLTVPWGRRRLQGRRMVEVHGGPHIPHRWRFTWRMATSRRLLTGTSFSLAQLGIASADTTC
jgi:hypothetical protein